MQCKECKTQIPEGVKYCPDCGAMIRENPTQQNQPVYPDPDYSVGNIQSQQIPYTSQQTPPAQKKRKKINIPGIIISIIIAAVVPIVTSYFYSIRSGSGDAPKTDYESVAVSYFDNVLNGTNTDAAATATAVDFVVVYEDMIDFYSKSAGATQEEYLDFLSDNYMIKITNAKQLLDADFTFIYDSFDDLVLEEFGTYTLSCSVADSDKLTDENVAYYYEKLDDSLSSIGKSTDDYIEKSAVTEAYKIKVEYVIDGSKTSDEYTNIDNFTTIVVGTSDGYKVLYDDYFIDTLLTMMTQEAE